MSRHRWYDSAAWQRRRAAQLAAEPLCRYCQARGILTPATVADHIEPHRGDAAKFWRGALQSLCARCHSGAKQAQENNGTLRGCDLDGEPLDGAHHWRR